MTWRNRNLYLIGLPGAGKSAIGRELSELLRRYRYSFVDLDIETERLAGQPIPEIFAKHGEARFRDLETQALLNVSTTNGSHYIIATGGGVMMKPLNRSIIRGSGIPIWIDVTVRDAAKNVLGDILRGKDRPLFRAASADELKEKLRILLEERRPYYEQATLHFVTRSVRGDERTPPELAKELLTALDKMSLHVALKPPHRTLLAHSALGDYPILVGSGIACRELSQTILDAGYTKAIVITDNNVDSLHGKELITKLQKEIRKQCDLYKIVIDAGEAKKSQETLGTILERLHEIDANRRSTLIVSFGGGVITDIAGFAASLYHRGLPLVHIPTTLLAQADAAIGGKTGIDMFGAKNLIGTFYPPRQILVDPLYLKTLPKRELHAGLAEVFKYALIGSADLWQSLAKSVRRLIRGVDTSYEEIIYSSIIEKLRYVEADEFERKQGIRELLNFGHTFGHALESASNYALLHGEAVLLGMRGAAWLSMKNKYIDEAAWIEIESVLGRIPIKGEIIFSVEDAVRMFKKDKKGSNRVILLRKIGEAFVDEISDAAVRETLEYLFTLA